MIDPHYVLNQSFTANRLANALSSDLLRAKTFSAHRVRAVHQIDPETSAAPAATNSAAAGRPETGSGGGGAAAAASVGMTASDFHNSAYLSLISDVARARTARLKQ